MLRTVDRYRSGGVRSSGRLRARSSSVVTLVSLLWDFWCVVVVRFNLWRCSLGLSEQEEHARKNRVLDVMGVPWCDGIVVLNWMPAVQDPSVVL